MSFSDTRSLFVTHAAAVHLTPGALTAHTGALPINAFQNEMHRAPMEPSEWMYFIKVEIGVSYAGTGPNKCTRVICTFDVCVRFRFRRIHKFTLIHRHRPRCVGRCKNKSLPGPAHTHTHNHKSTSNKYRMPKCPLPRECGHDKMYSSV